MTRTAWILVGAALGPGLFLFDRLMLKLEERGWIYYRKRRADPRNIGNAVLELQSILQPEKRYVIEAKLEERMEQVDEAGRKSSDRSEPH